MYIKKEGNRVAFIMQGAKERVSVDEATKLIYELKQVVKRIKAGDCEV